MTAIFLDTHAWIWLAAGDARLRRHERMLNRAALAGNLRLSAISLYECALIGLESEGGKRRGKQVVLMRPTVHEWLRDAERLTRVRVVPVEGAHAIDAATLHAMHADPFDRLIVAAALSSQAQLMTADVKIIAFAKSAGVSVLEI